MENKTKMAFFNQKQIRRVWDNKKETWFFSVIDIVAALTNSLNPRDYWYKMKTRVKTEEGLELSTICRQLKISASDGKFYLTDCANTESLFRIIQSIPSPKAEPFKLWLAKVGYERVEEITDPEKSINRARENWQKLGHGLKWIQQRMMGQEVRNKLTDYWSNNGIKKGNEFAILTNIIHQEWTGLTVSEHKKLKNLKTENLRDHMTDAELVFTALAELSTRQIAESENAIGISKNKIVSKKGGGIAKRAKLELEEKTGKKVISNQNYKLQNNQNFKKLK